MAIRPFSLITGFLCYCLWLSPVAGQLLPGAAPAAPPPPTVTEIRVSYVGFKNVSEQYILGNIQLQAGQPFSQRQADQSIRSLYQTGLFEFIQILSEPAGRNQVVIIFEVTPKYRVSEIVFEGNRRATRTRLMRELTFQRGAFVDDFLAKRNVDKLTEYYSKRGFTDAVIAYEIIRNPDTGTARVTFIVDEGVRVRISRISFEGNETFSDRRLRRAIETRRYNLFISWLTGSGRLDEDKFREDLTRLLTFYRNQGFLDVQVVQDGIKIEYTSDNRIEILIPVIEGRRYELGVTRLIGNTIFTDQELRPLLRMLPGDTFSPERVDQDVEMIRNYYGSRGYLDTFVRAERVPNLETGAIDLDLTIFESERFRVESINIQGNTKTRNRVILRELALAPGDIFDLMRMESSKARLENTRFFDDVILSPEPTNIPGRRNLRVLVQEGRTGNLTFGAGFSSLERAVFFAEISQSNFDLFNWRSFFQGAGQKFRLRFSVGSRSNELVISFEEPWLFHQRLALGFEFFRRETDFFSAVFNERRTGFEVYLRRRLFELVEGRISYRFETVDIFDVSPFASPIIQREAGERTVSKVGFTLLRDTRDRIIFTRRGNRLLALTEYAGGPFGGNTDYWRGELRGAQFYPTFETFDQSISIIARVGTISPTKDDPVPFFDRYFLGGPESIRGFQFRDVGPKDEFGEPIGGNSYGFFSLEYAFQIADPLQLALFYDWGFINDSDFDWSPADYNDSWGFGIRILVMGAPLNLDLGFPLTTRDNDRGRQFNFRFGTRF
jgi:outer membrane protein insertion porin family